MCASESVSDCYVYLKKIKLVCRAPIFITFGVPGTGIFRSMAHMFSDVFRSVGFTLENWENPLLVAPPFQLSDQGAIRTVLRWAMELGKTS